MLSVRIVMTLSGAVAGGIAIGVQLVASLAWLYPAAALVAAVPGTHLLTGRLSVESAAVIVMSLLGGALLSGPTAATLTSAARRVTTHQPQRHFWRSAAIWSGGCAVSLVLLVLAAPHVGNQPLPLALMAMLCGAAISVANP